jgi:PEP-CTERM motif-containing protein
MFRTRIMVATLGVVFISSPALASSILPSFTGSIAPNGSAWPALTGHHSHGTMVNAGEMGVEEERGIVEFNLAAESPAASVLLTFNNAPYVTCCVGTTGGTYTIGVFAYVGNNAFDLSDFQAPGVLLGTFSTAGLAVGTPFSFDVTAAFNANAGGNLGIRLQALSEPSQTSYTFNSFALGTTPAAVPEPATMLMLGTGLASAAARFRRRRTPRATA